MSKFISVGGMYFRKDEVISWKIDDGTLIIRLKNVVATSQIKCLLSSFIRFTKQMEEK